MELSVCLPVYNCEKFIKQTISSIINQTYKGFELIIVDNASTDNTVNIIKSFKDERIKFIQNEKNLGAPANWNKAISLAKGNYIALFHGDDKYKPDILMEELNVLQNNFDIGVVFSLGDIIDENNIIINRKLGIPDFLNKTDQIIEYDLTSFSINLMKYGAAKFLSCPSAMFNRKIFDKIGLFDTNYKVAYDLDMWYKILNNNFKIAYLIKNLYYLRVSQEQESFKYNFSRMEVYEFYPMIEKNILFNEILKTKINKKYIHKFYKEYIKDYLSVIKNCKNQNNINLKNQNLISAKKLLKKLNLFYKIKMFLKLKFI